MVTLLFSLWSKTVDIGTNTKTVCKIIQFSLLSFSLFFSASSIGAIYKWTDEHGKVHYGSQKPPSNKAERLKLKIRNPIIQEKTDDEKNAKTGGEKAAKPEEKEPQLSRKERKRLCKESREDVARIKENNRFRVKGKDGELRYLTPKEVAERLKIAQEDVRELCR